MWRVVSTRRSQAASDLANEHYHLNETQNWTYVRNSSSISLGSNSNPSNMWGNVGRVELLFGKPSGTSIVPDVGCGLDDLSLMFGSPASTYCNGESVSSVVTSSGTTAGIDSRGWGVYNWLDDFNCCPGSAGSRCNSEYLLPRQKC